MCSCITVITSDHQCWSDKEKRRERRLIVMDQILAHVSSVSFLSSFIILTSIEHYAQGSDTAVCTDTASGLANEQIKEASDDQ